MPPTQKEQNAIADVLFEIDNLLQALDRLIAKKRAVKQGAMQQLLTPPQLGDKRLEGFNGEWEVKNLGELGTIIRGASPRPKGDPRYYGGKVPRLMVKDVTRDGKYVTPKIDFLTEAGALLSRPCKAGTLTIVCSGTVGVPSILAVDACIHDGFLAIIDLSEDIELNYLYQLLSTLREKFDQSATHGGVFTNLTTSILADFQVNIPPFEEQKIIAKILDEIDTEIQSLETQRAKYQAVKQGMMQELLTGKTRLV